MDKQQASEMVRFFIVGAAVVLTDFAIYFVLCRVLPPSVSKTISFICAGVVSYLLNKRWVFKSSRQSSAEMVRFAVFNLFLLVLNVLTNYCMLNLLPENRLLALLIATLVTSITSYIGFKWWVFPNPASK